MAYTKQTWTNDVSALSAGRMNYMEDGIEAAHNLGSIPAGAIVQYGGASAPTGWLLCDGSSVLRSTYAALFTAISTAYGSVDGTHFTLPDLRGRLPVGLGTHADVNALGDNDGSALADRRPAHKHTVNDAGHTHTVPEATSQNTNQNLAVVGDTIRGTSIATSSATTGVTVGPQTNVPSDGPAFVTVNYIIKT